MKKHLFITIMCGIMIFSAGCSNSAGNIETNDIESETNDVKSKTDEIDNETNEIQTSEMVDSKMPINSDTSANEAIEIMRNRTYPDNPYQKLDSEYTNNDWALGGTSGGSKATQTAEYIAEKIGDSGKTAEDFFIYSGCGRNDIAQPNLTPQIEAMKKLTDTFIYSDNFANGNLYQYIYEQGGHDVNTVISIMYNGFPKMFG